MYVCACCWLSGSVSVAPRWQHRHLPLLPPLAALTAATPRHLSCIPSSLGSSVKKTKTKKRRHRNDSQQDLLLERFYFVGVVFFFPDRLMTDTFTLNWLNLCLFASLPGWEKKILHGDTHTNARTHTGIGNSTGMLPDVHRGPDWEKFSVFVFFLARQWW